MYSLRLLNTTMSVSINKLNVSIVQCSDIPRVVDYLIEHYFTDEPLSKCTVLIESPEAVEFLRKFCTDALQQNVSVVAKTGDGEIVAVSCNMVLRKDQKLDFGTDPIINKIGEFITQVEEGCELSVKCPNLDDYLYIAFMSVHTDYRRQGLAKRLIDYSRELAVKLGLKFMRMDCCSFYTAKAANRLGWTCLNEVEYKEYKIDEQQVFCPDEPHTAFGVYFVSTEHSGYLNPPST